MDLYLNSINDIPNVAKQFLEEFGHRACYAFYGDMGAGKTTFITGLLKAMGIDSPEGSPTYSLVNVYDTPAYGRVFHFDFYRLISETEALDIGIEEMLYGGGISFIEWPEKIFQLLPENTVSVYISKHHDDSRTLKVKL